MKDEQEPSMQAAYQGRLRDLMLEHRDLDAAIHRLSVDPLHDQLALQRMKKRKLLLKDQIFWLERQLDPDEPA
jgi:hypothetical protein